MKTFVVWLLLAADVASCNAVVIHSVSGIPRKPRVPRLPGPGKPRKGYSNV